MEKVIRSISITICILIATVIIMTIIGNISGYSSGGDTSQVLTHSILIALIFTVIYCTLTIIEELNSIKKKIDKDKSIE